MNVLLGAAEPFPVRPNLAHRVEDHAEPNVFLSKEPQQLWGPGGDGCVPDHIVVKERQRLTRPAKGLDPISSTRQPIRVRYAVYWLYVSNDKVREFSPKFRDSLCSLLGHP